MNNVDNRHTVNTIIDNLGSTHNVILKFREKNKSQEELIMQEPGMQSTLLLYVTDYDHSTPLMHGDIKKRYRSVYWNELPGQGKESCTESLIEHHVVNCLCVGGEKSICFLTAVTSGPWGEKLEQTDRHTHAHTHTHTYTRTRLALPKPLKPCLASPISHIEAHSFSTGTHTPSRVNRDVHEGLLSQGRARSIY